MEILGLAFKDHQTTVIIATAVLGLVLIYKLMTGKKEKLPPGPPGWPVIGNLYGMLWTPSHLPKRNMFIGKKVDCNKGQVGFSKEIVCKIRIRHFLTRPFKKLCMSWLRQPLPAAILVFCAIVRWVQHCYRCFRHAVPALDEKFEAFWGSENGFARHSLTLCN